MCMVFLVETAGCPSSLKERVVGMVVNVSVLLWGRSSAPSGYPWVDLGRPVVRLMMIILLVTAIFNPVT